MTSRAAADRQIKDDRQAVPQIPPALPRGSRYLNYSTNHMTFPACASASERSPTAIGDRDASDLDRLAASLDALALCYCEPDVEEAGYGDGTGEEPAGEVVAMSTHSFMPPGAFDP